MSDSVDRFDRAMGALVGVPDVLQTKPAPIRVATPMIGNAMTFIVQTFRQREEGATDDAPATIKETIFLEYSDAETNHRIVIPPEVVRAIHRQHDSLASRARTRAAKAVAEERRALGLKPGFMKSKA